MIINNINGNGYMQLNKLLQKYMDLNGGINNLIIKRSIQIANEKIIQLF